VQRETEATAAQPHANANFRVDLGDPGGREQGFCEVVFPEFRVDAREPGHASAASRPARHDDSEASPYLTLRRGVTGSLDLYAWWDAARRSKAPPRRTVTVQLLAADHATVVLTWTFRRARPVSLSYAPLNALQGAVLIETLVLDFETMEMR
jgi:phage tail-like protein